MRINSRTAPEIYLGAAPITRGGDGGLRVGGPGTPIEWVVRMRRFPQEDLLDRMAEQGRLTRPLIRELAEIVAKFHSEAERAPAGSPLGGGAALETTVGVSLAELAERPDWFGTGDLEVVRVAAGDVLRRTAPILDRRKSEGYVRHCHGDLHLGNICLLHGRPTLFDAIEFNDSLAWVDVLHDLAFLLMDLEHRGLRDFSNLLFTRYLVETGDLDGLGALPLLLADRALVRAKVNAAAAEGMRDQQRLSHLRDEATAYLAAARSYLEPAAPRMVAIGGLSGTGKTTLAGRLAPSVGASPGAAHLRSDVIRKRLAGVEETERLGQRHYDAASSEAVYEALNDQARRILTAGHSVVVDGVFARPEEREAIEGVARACGAAFDGIWLEAAPETLVDRVEARSGDASDATAEVVRLQARYELGPLTWPKLLAEGAPATVEKAARQRLRL